MFAINYGAGTKIELYNTVAGFTTNTANFFLQINSDSIQPVVGAKGDVIIDALTVGTLPSSITTTNSVAILGDNVTINSTINHKLNSAGGVQGDVDLIIGASKSVTINKSIGAGQDVLITGNGNIVTAKGANILSDTDKNGVGGIFIVNNSNTGGSTTQIDGNLDTSTASPDDIQVIHNGVSTAKVVVAGNVTTHQGGDILVWSDGGIDLSGVFMGSDDVSITALGQSAVLRGPITADVDGPGNGLIAYAAPFAQTKLYPTAVLTAPNVLLGFADNPTPLIQSLLGGWIGTNSIAGVNATGGAYAKAADKPAVQILTNNLTAVLFGSLNAPIAGNSDWLQNQLQINPLDPTIPVAMSLSAMGAGPQFINLGSTGDVWVDSGLTVTPFFAVGLTSGTAFPVGTAGGQRRQLADHQCGGCAERREQQRRAGFDGVDRRAWVPHRRIWERVLRVPGRRGAEVGRSADPVRADVQRVDRDGATVPRLLVRSAEDRSAGVLRDPGQRPGERELGAAGWDAEHLRDQSGFAGFVRFRHQVRSRLLQHVLEGDHRHADQPLPDRVRLLTCVAISPQGDRKGRLRAPFF